MMRPLAAVLLATVVLSLFAATWTSGMKYGYTKARAEFSAANCGAKKTSR